MIHYGLVALNIIIRLYSSLRMIIPDCDETFNYWEPLNFLLRGFGKETWEYSPDFAIRSYSYLLSYYTISYPINFIVTKLQLPEYYIFYFIRTFLLNGFTVISELKLYYSLKTNYNSTIANWYLFFSSISPGMAHGGVALLPSSWAMQCVNMSISYSLNDLTTTNAVMALTWIMMGGLIGWPFILVLGIPFGIYLLATTINLNFKSTVNKLFPIIGKALINLITILIIIITIDSFFYKRLVLIPLNIVLYNVFGGEGEGPEIFGVEPFSYYVLNLLLNFNIIGILGFLGVLLTFTTNKNGLVINGPLIIWCLIFGSQPHKEERFLYPIYGLILVNAAITINLLLSHIQKGLQLIFSNKGLIKTILHIGRLALILTTFIISILRIINLVENYDAPLTVSKSLFSINNKDGNNKPNDLVNVCIGREWYHFPNSFFLPENHRLRFVKSGFDGLLPGDFQEGKSMFELTSFIPKEMNNKNEFVESMVIPFSECHYYIDNSGKTNGIEPDLIDSSSSSSIPSSLQPNWDIIHCHKLINPDGNHGGIGRLLYVPPIIRDFIPYDVDYMQFCLLKNTTP